MENNKIVIEATINAEAYKVWEYYTQPNHITKWNFAHPSWHCPTAENDMKVGGTYRARMEAVDGSFGFYFEAIYSQILEGKSFTYAMADREVNVVFNDLGEKTNLVITFDPETENSIELQKQGWQAILDNFKIYAEKTFEK
jgi:uncharacterized protein YndB with AHSA1/START domain